MWVPLFRKWYRLLSKPCFSVSSEQQSICSIEILGLENVLPKHHRCLLSQMLRQAGGVPSGSGASVAPEDPAFGRLWGRPTLGWLGFFQTEPCEALSPCKAEGVERALHAEKLLTPEILFPAGPLSVRPGGMVVAAACFSLCLLAEWRGPDLRTDS